MEGRKRERKGLCGRSQKRISLDNAALSILMPEIMVLKKQWCWRDWRVGCSGYSRVSEKWKVVTYIRIVEMETGILKNAQNFRMT